MIMKYSMLTCSSSSSSGEGDGVTLLVREVVEVKSTCPFALRERRGGGGGARQRGKAKGKRGAAGFDWMVSDRGLRTRVSPL